MREIKFRAWDTVDQRMVINSGTRTEANGFNYPWGFQTGSHIIELMQYTELKDKNGKEIYEGDIVRTDGVREYQPSWEVKWNTDKGSWVLDPHSPEIPQGNLNSIACKSNEVIGNIYENSELVSVPK